MDPALGSSQPLVPRVGIDADFDEDRRHLIVQICHGAISYKDIKDREVRPVVKSWLSDGHQELVESTPRATAVAERAKPEDHVCRR